MKIIIPIIRPNNNNFSMNKRTHGPNGYFFEYVMHCDKFLHILQTFLLLFQSRNNLYVYLKIIFNSFIIFMIYIYILYDIDRISIDEISFSPACTRCWRARVLFFSTTKRQAIRHGTQIPCTFLLIRKDDLRARLHSIRKYRSDRLKQKKEQQTETTHCD